LKRYALVMARTDGSVIEPVGSDLVALAQAHALDVSTFPHASLPAVYGSSPPVLWIARAERGGPVVGFVVLHAGHELDEVSAIAVANSHRRSGLGRALLRVAVRAARMRRVPVLALHVSTANAAAIRLYSSEGFLKMKRLFCYYQSPSFEDGGDAWLMMKDLR
jgi:ribosomal protein S18 acetylase RimI-like enzyme